MRILGAVLGLVLVLSGLGLSPASAVASLPGAPTGVVATPGTANSVTLDWVGGADNGSAISDSIAQYSWDGGVTWSDDLGDHSGHTTNNGHTLSDVTFSAGTFLFRVASINGVGQGPWSAPAQATISGDDTIDPVITAVTVVTPWVATTSADHTAYADVTVKDNIGIDSVQAWAGPPGSHAGARSTHVTSGEIAGDPAARSLTVRVPLTVPAGAALGAWSIDELMVTDARFRNGHEDGDGRQYHYLCTDAVPPYPGFVCPTFTVTNVNLAAAGTPAIRGKVKSGKTVSVAAAVPAGAGVAYAWKLTWKVTRKVRVKKHGHWVKVKRKVAVTKVVSHAGKMKLKKAWRKRKVSVTATYSSPGLPAVAKGSAAKTIK